ncbi:unnamed protein product [Diatraea saccharalis]|uniref:Fibronectin type-III domain-containing protein n=1 Tax=Diatraea saccharalis TaxID=40085 RepID=A0A9N9WCV9_9NEOP|nr:unnamed protein product [Diatraea saccharalis]
MRSKLNGSDIRTFFNRTRNTTEKICNCPENPQVAKSFVIDMSTSNQELYYIDPWVHQILAADMNGCKCRVVVDATEKKKHGFTPMSITVDSKYVYWFNSTENEIFYAVKSKSQKIEHARISHGNKIMALDAANQPYPPQDCLYPKLQHLQPRVLSNSAYSLTLQMPSIHKPQHCRHLEYEMTTPEYTVYYRLYSENDRTDCNKESCSYITTTRSEVILDDLKPFTKYIVMIGATNFYAKLYEVKPLIGSPIILQTAAEAPTAPKNVTVIALSPVQARVEWIPDPGLKYEVHWRTNDSTSSPHRYKEHSTFEVSSGGSVVMSRLAPGTVYAVWVRARSAHSTQPADSAPLRLATYPAPAPLQLRHKAAYRLRLAWPPPLTYTLYRHRVEYTEASVINGTWKECANRGDDEWTANNLRPHKGYRFRLCLQYVKEAPPYYWPEDDRFIYETLGDVPAAPSSVLVEAVEERVIRVWWSEPDSRGSPITMYRVWGRPMHSIAINILIHILLILTYSMFRYDSTGITVLQK